MTGTLQAKPKVSPKADRGRAVDSTLALARPVAHAIGGHVALDFCNTAGEHLAEKPDEMLGDWESFIRWATQAGLIGAESYVELLRHPGTVGPIIELREAIYRLGLAIAGKRPLLKRDLAWICKQANATKPDITLEGKNGLRCRPNPTCGSAELRSLLANEALSLLCSPKASRIGVCEGGMCGWLFLDESRGKRRRWCDMNDCGNRAKARVYYQRHKGQ
jgi:predicted RNA-binding Zn ribbon-like protein